MVLYSVGNCVYSYSRDETITHTRKDETMATVSTTQAIARLRQAVAARSDEQLLDVYRGLFWDKTREGATVRRFVFAELANRHGEELTDAMLTEIDDLMIFGPETSNK